MALPPAHVMNGSSSSCSCDEWLFLPPKEIPLFRVMTATVTFQNVNGTTQPAPFVSLKADHTHLGVESEPVPAPSASKEGIWRRRGRESARQEENSDMPLLTKQRYDIVIDN